MLENINLSQADIVDVEDFVDNRKDLFWAHIEGSMIDYTIDDTNSRVVSGDSKKAENLHRALEVCPHRKHLGARRDRSKRFIVRSERLRSQER
jgi:hypothetical protein